MFVLLSHIQCSPDLELQRLCAAALLAFSIQNECQLQIDRISGISVLLRMLEVRDTGKHTRDVSLLFIHTEALWLSIDLNMYAAGILWNLSKSPLLMLKLETTHGILKESLLRRLTDLLWTPLEPFQLAVRPTGERGITGIIESDTDNLGLMISTSISQELSIVLQVENYVGPSRSLTDQYSNAAKTRSSKRGEAGPEQKSTAHYDESGVLSSRTCAVCSKPIRVTKRRPLTSRHAFLLCARASCGQTYHVRCSRWASLDPEEDDMDPARFHCSACVSLVPLYYWDFVAQNSTQHALLLSENLFNSVAIRRCDVLAKPDSNGINALSGGAAHDGAPEFVMLFKRANELMGIGRALYKIPASSKDEEMLIVAIAFTTLAAYPATHQASRTTAKQTDNDSSEVDDAPSDPWSVSYASEDATDIPWQAGRTVFWPSGHTLPVSSSEYTERSLEQLETAFMYEFQGEQPNAKAFSVGATIQPPSETSEKALPLSMPVHGLWMALHPRKGICMKMLAAQIGRAKQLVIPVTSTGDCLAPEPQDRGATPKATARKTAKPHFAGKKLSRVATSG